MSSYDVSVIGTGKSPAHTGGIARTHGRTYRSLGRTSMVACADVDLDAATTW